MPAYELFASTEILGRMALEKMLAGLSTRRYPVGLEPVGEQVQGTARSTSKSAESRKFVKLTETALADLLAADLSDLDLVAVMIDGVHFADHLCVVALGIDLDGTKHPLAVGKAPRRTPPWSGVCWFGLRDRGLDVTKPILAVLDGAWALTAAVLEVFDQPVIGRVSCTSCATCVITCPSRSADPSGSGCGSPTTPALPSRPRPYSPRWPRSWTRPTPAPRPSLREGMHETLRSTNAIESMISISRDHARNVKRWRDGQMALRWCAAGTVTRPSSSAA